jgi:dTDP-4-dehydrorhamnose 3,5-epimerase-like enzyme
MTTEQTFIKDLVILTKNIQRRAWLFFEAYNQATFYENGIKHEFIQDNQSFSKKVIKIRETAL